jgi:hypothetical protein
MIETDHLREATSPRASAGDEVRSGRELAEHLGVSLLPRAVMSGRLKALPPVLLASRHRLPPVTAVPMRPIGSHGVSTWVKLFFRVCRRSCRLTYVGTPCDPIVLFGGTLSSVVGLDIRGPPPSFLRRAFQPTRASNPQTGETSNDHHYESIAPVGHSS